MGNKEKEVCTLSKNVNGLSGISIGLMGRISLMRKQKRPYFGRNDLAGE